MNKTISKILLLIIIIIVILSYMFTFLLPGVKHYESSHLIKNPRLIENFDKDIIVVSENPDLIWEDLSGLEEKIYEDDFGAKFVSMENEGKFLPFYANGHYLAEYSVIDRNKKGVISLHPESLIKPHCLEQEITLDSNDYIVVATIANLAEYFEPCAPCSDNIFKIKIIDSNTKSKEKIYEEVINSTQGWQTIYLNISDYKNKKIIFRIEGHAGGFCGTGDPFWCGEYGFVDEFYIARLE